MVGVAALHVARAQSADAPSTFYLYPSGMQSVLEVTTVQGVPGPEPEAVDLSQTRLPEPPKAVEQARGFIEIAIRGHVIVPAISQDLQSTRPVRLSSLFLDCALPGATVGPRRTLVDRLYKVDKEQRATGIEP